jgi:hypothetical protein
MKKTFAVLAGSLVAVLVVLVLTARVVGFDPGLTRPGLWLTGQVATEPVAEWSFAARIPGLLMIQTRQWFFPWLAHSVTIARFHHHDRLYVASGYPAGIELPNGRHWNRNVMADPRVRIKIGDTLYDQTLVYVTDPMEREELLRAFGPMFWSPGFLLHLWRIEPLE